MNETTTTTLNVDARRAGRFSNDDRLVVTGELCEVIDDSDEPVSFHLEVLASDLHEVVRLFGEPVRATVEIIAEGCFDRDGGTCDITAARFYRWEGMEIAVTAEVYCHQAPESVTGNEWQPLLVTTGEHLAHALAQYENGRHRVTAIETGKGQIVRFCQT
jgi:hypothetical protein